MKNRMRKKLIARSYCNLLNKPAGFFSLKKYRFIKLFNNNDTDLGIYPWRFLDEVSKYTRD